MTKHLPKSSENLKKIMTEYYTSNHQRAAEGKFVLWVAIIVPIELLQGFDLVVAVPENHSAMCAARGIGAQQAEVAENSGYSMDLCSYARIDLGTTFNRGEGSPSKGLPFPDLLISNTNNCSLLSKWFDVYHREMGIPHYILDVPFCYGPQKDADLHYILDQYKDLIRVIEEMTGQKIDMDRVGRAVEHSQNAHREWKRFLSFAQNRPSGITAFDSFVHMAPYLTSFRGTKTLEEHFRLLADETEEQVSNNQYPVPGEKYKLLWDNIAPWHQLRNMSTRLAEYNGNICCATYTSCIGSLEGDASLYEGDSSDPLTYLARIQNSSVCPSGLDLRYKMISRMIDMYSIDGVVFASNRSCKPYSLMQLDLQNRISAYKNIPSVMVDVDHADVRKFNPENTFLKIEALLEEIEQKSSDRN